jgi:osmotically-inducible protein OsmY
MNRNIGYLSPSLLLSLLLISFGTLVVAQDPAQNSPAADNTKMNQRDRNPNEPTADRQQNNRSDLDITKQIRQSIVDDQSMSSDASNVKVITQNGKVTLKGPVQSDDEKRAVEAKAAAIAGEANVSSQLTVKPKS